MKQPTMSQFDAWRKSRVGQWFFEHYLAGYVAETAMENGKNIGQEESDPLADHMKRVWSAGFIHGVEHAISDDPFEEERHETTSSGPDASGPPGE